LLIFYHEGSISQCLIEQTVWFSCRKKYFGVGVHEGVRCGCAGEKGRRWRRCLFAWAQWCSLVLLWGSLSYQGYLLFYNLIKILISYCIFTFNYSNNVDLATQNKFIFENIVDIWKTKKIYHLIDKFILFVNNKNC
jgi:hypothetical protein